jgi:hypothetical protein
MIPKPNHPHVHLAVEDFCDDDTDPYADIGYWSKLSYWTVDEATALSFGFEPRVVTADLLPHGDHPFTLEYRNRRELAIRDQDLGQLQARIPPIDYVKWAKRADVPFSPKLEAAVHEKVKTKNKRGGADTGHPRAKNSISKMLVGLAVGGYKYDPTKRSNIPREIADDLSKIGLAIGDDTVRKILTEAADDVGYLVKSKNNSK